MTERCVALVPAAGVGRRFGADEPKQYLSVVGQTVIEHTLDALLRARWLDKVYVILSAEDATWHEKTRHSRRRWGQRVVVHDCGGPTRRDTVFAGLDAIGAELGVAANPWVFVHDAARPGLPLERLQALHDALNSAGEGALLAVPVADTLKRCDHAKRVTATLDRSALWLAQTPQVFRLRDLRRALRGASLVTDEASAMEQAGFQPQLVTGSWRNTKLTHFADLELVRLALENPGNTR